MSHVQVPFGWKTATCTEAHSYLLPAVLTAVDRFAAGRPLRLLDLGCGNGSVTAHLAARGHEVTGVDASPDGIAIAIAVAGHRGIRFELASIYDDDLADRVGGDFDCVVSLEVIEHLFLPGRLLEQARRALRPGGRLVLSTPYHGYLKNLAISLVNGWDRHFAVAMDGGHIKFFSARTVTALVRQAGFRPLATRGAGRWPGLWKSILMEAER